MSSTSVQEKRDVVTEYNELMFDVRRSVRYHSKRRHFYESCYKTVLFIGFLSGPATVFIHETDWPDLTIFLPSMVVSVLTGLSLVFNLYQKAALHIELMRQFVELERELEAGRSHPTEELIDRVTDKRLQIEANEPAILRVLDIVCHNELSRAMGYEKKDLYEVKFHQRLLKHFFDWNPDGIQQPH